MFLSVLFGVCICSATLHKYNPPSLWFNNTHTHTPLCLSRLSTSLPLLSLSVCVSLLSSSYLLSVSLFVCLPEWVCVYLCLCACVCMAVKLSVFQSEWLVVCLCSRNGVKTNHFKVCVCVCVSLPGQFALMLSDWRKSIRAL